MQYKHTIMGMSCEHCAENVHKLLEELHLDSIKISFKKGLIEYNDDYDRFTDIQTRLNKSDYKVTSYKTTTITTYLAYIMIVVLFLLLSKLAYNQFDVIKLNSPTAYLSILIFGLITSLHCVGMCGGIALSVTNFTTPYINIRNTLLYNLGRLTTYTLIGGLLGLIGSQIAISDQFKTFMFFFIGSVMLLIGFNNLGLIKFRLKKINLLKQTSFKSKTPLFIGLLNGFMPCAPLQTMQLLALTTSSMWQGAIVMLAFGIGTMPLLLLFSNIGLILKKKHLHHIGKVSAIIVILMSVMIFQQGFNSLGTTFIQSPTEDLPFAEVIDGYQIVNIEVDPYYYIDAVQVKKDMPVKLLIHVTSVSGCTANIMVPKYNVNTDLIKGQTHELIFTPTKAENLKITCWMSMVNTYLNIVE